MGEGGEVRRHQGAVIIGAVHDGASSKRMTGPLDRRAGAIFALWNVAKELETFENAAKLAA